MLTLWLWQIRQDLASNGISVYPQKEYDEDPQERIINDRIRVTTISLFYIKGFLCVLECGKNHAVAGIHIDYYN